MRTLISSIVPSIVPSIAPSIVPGLRRSAFAMLAVLASATAVHAQRGREAPVLESNEVADLFQIESELLTEFWGRPMTIEAGVVLPPGHSPDEHLPVCYNVHGFGGSHQSAWRQGAELRRAMLQDGYPRMVYVFLNAQFPMGHHEFADSVNNGPWGEALVTEFLPALEAEYAPKTRPEDRFLTGHSSGGWSSLWLMVNYRRLFGSTWSTAPDSVDFRDFTGIDVYSFENAFVDPHGEEIQLVRQDGKFVASIRRFVEAEQRDEPIGGQFYSFNAVFSPRAADGTPWKVFDPATGAIDPAVRERWRQYDISWQLSHHWAEWKDDLAGKIHVYMGEQDTFRLEGALKLMDADLRAIGADVDLVFVPGRDHGTLFQPHPELWPEGMMAHIHRQMRARFDRNGG